METSVPLMKKMTDSHTPKAIPHSQWFRPLFFIFLLFMFIVVVNSLQVAVAPASIDDYIRLPQGKDFACFGFRDSCMNRTIELCNLNSSSETISSGRVKFDFGMSENLSSVIFHSPSKINNTYEVEDTCQVLSPINETPPARKNITCKVNTTIEGWQITPISIPVSSLGRWAGSVQFPANTCYNLTVRPTLSDSIRRAGKFEYNVTWLSQILDPFVNAFNFTEDFNNSNEVNTTSPSIFNSTIFNGTLFVNWTLNSTFVNTSVNCSSTGPIQGGGCDKVLDGVCKGTEDLNTIWIMFCSGGGPCRGATHTINLGQNMTVSNVIYTPDNTGFVPSWETYITTAPFPKYDGACASTGCDMNFQNFSSDLVFNGSMAMPQGCANASINNTPHIGQYVHTRVWAVGSDANPRFGEITPVTINITNGGSSMRSVTFNFSQNMSAVKWGMNRTLFSGTIGFNVSCDGGVNFCGPGNTSDGATVPCCGTSRNDSIVYQISTPKINDYLAAFVTMLNLEALPATSSNVGPSVQNISFTPNASVANVVNSTTINASFAFSDDSNTSLGVITKWFRNGTIVQVERFTVTTLSNMSIGYNNSNGKVKGDLIQIEINVTDGSASNVTNSTSFLINNTIPELINVGIFTINSTNQTPINGSFLFKDNDSDIIGFNITWFKNTTSIIQRRNATSTSTASTTNISDTYTSGIRRLDNLTMQVVINDGTVTSTSQNTTVMQILNVNSTIIGIGRFPLFPQNTTPINFSAIFQDNDSDTINWNLTVYRNFTIIVFRSNGTATNGTNISVNYNGPIIRNDNLTAEWGFGDQTTQIPSVNDTILSIANSPTRITNIGHFPQNPINNSVLNFSAVFLDNDTIDTIQWNITIYRNLSLVTFRLNGTASNGTNISVNYNGAMVSGDNLTAEWGFGDQNVQQANVNDTSLFINFTFPTVSRIGFNPRPFYRTTNINASAIIQSDNSNITVNITWFVNDTVVQSVTTIVANNTNLSNTLTNTTGGYVVNSRITVQFSFNDSRFSNSTNSTQITVNNSLTVITLITPDVFTSNQNVTFNWTVADNDTSSPVLTYNTTLNGTTNYSSTGTNSTVVYGLGIDFNTPWNISANDTFGLYYSTIETMHVDSLKPAISIISNSSGTSSSLTIELNTSEPAFVEVLYNTTEPAVQFNMSIDTLATAQNITLTNLLSSQLYDYVIRVRDNVSTYPNWNNYTLLNTTTRDASNSVGGGGGSPQPLKGNITILGTRESFAVINIPNDNFTTESGTNMYDLFINPGGQRTKVLYLKNLNASKETKIVCVDYDNMTCSFVDISKKVITGVDHAEVYFTVSLPSNVNASTLQFQMQAIASPPQVVDVTLRVTQAAALLQFADKVFKPVSLPLLPAIHLPIIFVAVAAIIIAGFLFWVLYKFVMIFLVDKGGFNNP